MNLVLPPFRRKTYSSVNIAMRLWRMIFYTKIYGFILKHYLLISKLQNRKVICIQKMKKKFYHLNRVSDEEKKDNTKKVFE